MSPLVELAEKILANARKVDGYASEGRSGPVPFDIQQARLELLDASDELRKEVVEPESWLMQLLYGVSVRPL